jgi:hypothetical protein
MFFFEKKNQKTLAPAPSDLKPLGRLPGAPVRSI